MKIQEKNIVQKYIIFLLFLTQFLKSSGEPLGTKIINNLTLLFFVKIVTANPKEHALYLIHSLCFLKEMNF
ncbi:hypothetical protein MNBD_BACTEROID03-579 [hydrothermal vent metagenome]|uniref:Uncharacterized protein n=1 Tax=hydrothermal vent metagenome TaxID=652676 RepID=A0A3B0TDQ1_9ZZZZ